MLTAAAAVTGVCSCGSPERDGAQSSGAGSGSAGAGGSDGEAGSSSGGWSQPAVPCLMEPLTRREAAKLYFVLDVSSSMASNWDTVRVAVSDLIDSLPATMRVGLVLYPNQPTPDAHCVNRDSTVQPAELGDSDSEQRTLLRQILDDAIVGGGAATLDACQVAIASASVHAAGQGMILISDGHPTLAEECAGDGSSDTPVDAEPILEEIQRAYSASGDFTYVIGLPGSELASDEWASAQGWMSRAAQAGATAPAGCDLEGPAFCHFDVSSEDDWADVLADSLAEIVAQIRGCRFDLPWDGTREFAVDSATVELTGPSGESEDVPPRSS
jgi:hypothetical protein